MFSIFILFLWVYLTSLVSSMRYDATVNVTWHGEMAHTPNLQLLKKFTYKILMSIILMR